MKTSIRLAMGVAALAIILQASPAKAFLWGLTESSTCNEDWPKWKITLDAAGYALWKLTCVDTSGTGSPPENLGTNKAPGKKGPVVGYGSDPKKGFGSDIPVTLPPDRHPPAGKSTGIPVTRTSSTVLTNAQPKYFRPR